jgi:hypothetical protein
MYSLTHQSPAYFPLNSIAQRATQNPMRSLCSLLSNCHGFTPAVQDSGAATHASHSKQNSHTTTLGKKQPHMLSIHDRWNRGLRPRRPSEPTPATVLRHHNYIKSCRGTEASQHIRASLCKGNSFGCAVAPANMCDCLRRDLSEMCM